MDLTYTHLKTVHDQNTEIVCQKKKTSLTFCIDVLTLNSILVMQVWEETKEVVKRIENTF